MTAPPAGRGPARQRQRRPSRPTSRVKWKRLRADSLAPLGGAFPQYAFGVTTTPRTAEPLGLGVGIKTDQPNAEPIPKPKKPNFRFLLLVYLKSVFMFNNRIGIGRFGI